MKYLFRFGKKNGKNRKDLLKCIHYVCLLYHYSFGSEGVMRIIEEVKLDFNDVLIKPKRSTLISPKRALGQEIQIQTFK